LTDTFQDRIRLEKNFNDQMERAKLHKNDSEKVKSLQEIRYSIGNIKTKNDNIQVFCLRLDLLLHKT
jgi:hypothetical protein